MKKIVLLMVVLASFLSADAFWHGIHTYESEKIGENKYQVTKINDGNFTENHLFVNKVNNDILEKNGCKYMSLRHSDKIKIFDFRGDGSIKCNDKPISFISQYQDYNLLSFGNIIFDLFRMFLPMIGLLFAAGFFVVYAMTHKRIFIFMAWLSIFSTPVMMVQRAFFAESPCLKQNELIDVIFNKTEQDMNITLYRDPRIIPYHCEEYKKK